MPSIRFNPGIEPVSPALQVDSLPLSHQGSPSYWVTLTQTTEPLSASVFLSKNGVNNSAYLMGLL